MKAFIHGDQLLVAIRSLRVASQMSTSRMGVWSRVPIGKCRCLFRAISFVLRLRRRKLVALMLADLGAATGENLFQDIRQVLGKMEPVGYLPCLRGAFACGGGIILSWVTAYQSNLRMRLHPRLGRLRLPRLPAVGRVMVRRRIVVGEVTIPRRGAKRAPNSPHVTRPMASIVQNRACDTRLDN